MNNLPLRVSVIISTYNRCERLRRAVRSVLKQSFQGFELIIVDNASTDQTQNVVKEFCDERVSCHRHSQNKGGSAARNTGIKNAKGRYIALLDDDDEWFEQKLEKQVQKIEQLPSKVGLVYVGSEIYDENKKKVQSLNIPSFAGNIYKRLLLSTVIGSVSSVLVRRECFEKVGLFDEELTSCQDWDMWLRISKEFELDFVGETLVRINMHGEQISTDYSKLIPGRTTMIKKHWKEFENYPEIFVVHLKRLGKLHCLNGTWSEAPAWFLKAVSVRPFEFFKILAWCILELPLLMVFSNTKTFRKYNKL